MVFQIKAIKPKKMKLKAFQNIILKELGVQGKATEKEYEKTSATFKGEKPEYESIVDITGQDAAVLTGPVGSQKAVAKWRRLDEGTKPHIIRARNKPTLAFRIGGFKAKTKVRRVKSGRGRAASGPFIFPKQVRHPGFPAREWTPTIQKRRRKPFTRGMVRAMQRGTSKLYG